MERLTKILSLILIILIGVNGYIFYKHDLSLSLKDIGQGVDKIGYLTAYHLSISHKVKNDSVSRELSDKVSDDCYSDSCIIRNTRRYLRKNISYKVTDKYHSVNETLSRGYGDCKSKAIIGASILSLNNISIQYVLQKNHICLYVPKHGFINCFSERPIRYISPVIRTKS